MKRHLIAALLALTPAFALAGGDLRQQIVHLQSQGYDQIDVKTGPTQTKIEAVRGTRKLELVYHNASGTLLKREVEHADQDDDVYKGVRIRHRDRDFMDHADAHDD